MHSPPHAAHRELVKQVIRNHARHQLACGEIETQTIFLGKLPTKTLCMGLISIMACVII